MDCFRVDNILIGTHKKMAHFAEIDSNATVLRVIVVDDAHEASGADFLKYDLRLGGTWIQTSYNRTIRKNFAGIGYTYDALRDAFIAPKPFVSWILDETTCQWEASIPMPVEGMWSWDEDSLNWIQTQG